MFQSLYCLSAFQVISYLPNFHATKLKLVHLRRRRPQPLSSWTDRRQQNGSSFHTSCSSCPGPGIHPSGHGAVHSGHIHPIGLLHPQGQTTWTPSPILTGIAAPSYPSCRPRLPPLRPSMASPLAGRRPSWPPPPTESGPPTPTETTRAWTSALSAGSHRS